MLFSSTNSTPTWQDWAGIDVNSGATLELSHARIENAYMGVFADKSGTVVHIDNTEFYHNYYGAKLHDGSDKTISNSIFTNGYRGLMFWLCDGSVQNTVFSGFNTNWAVLVYYNAPTFDYITIDDRAGDNLHGIYAKYASPSIKHSLIADCNLTNGRGLGVNTNGNPQLWDYGTTSQTPKSVNNTFENNEKNIVISSGGTANLGTADNYYYTYWKGGFNWFRTPDSYFIENADSRTVNAELNWWGDVSPYFIYPYLSSTYFTGPYSWSPQAYEKFGVMAKSASQPEEIEPPVFTPAELRLRDGIMAFQDSAWVEAADIFTEVMETWPHDETAQTSLIWLRDVTWRSGENLPEKLTEIQTNSSNNKLKFRAEYYSIIEKMRKGEFESLIPMLMTLHNKKAHMKNQWPTALATILEDITLILDELKFRADNGEKGLGKSSEEYALDAENLRQQILKEYPFSAAAKELRLGRGISEPTPEILPTDFGLHAAYPNPFNPTTTISFDLPDVSNLKLQIYDILGRKVWEYSQKSLNAGSHQIVWDGRNLNNKQVAAGVYLIRMSTPEFTANQKVVYLK